MDGLSLELPSLDRLPSFREALAEDSSGLWPDEAVLLDSDPRAFVDSLTDMEATGTVTLPDGRRVPKVPQETLWLMHEKTFVGSFRLRTWLSANTELNGGHIGYTIRPSLRGRGAATRGLALAIERARAAHGLGRLLLTCAPDNPASRRVIKKNGGRYHDTVDAPHGIGPTMRFWVGARSLAQPPEMRT